MRLRRRELLAIAAFVVGTYIVIFTHFRVNRSAQQIREAPEEGRLTALTPPLESERRDSPRDRLNLVLSEPNPEVRRHLTYNYIHSLSPAEFPFAFDGLAKAAQGRQEPLLLDALLFTWVDVDPQGAWHHIRPMFDYAIPSRTSTSWSETLTPPRKPGRLAQSSFSPSTEFLRIFATAAMRADVTESERSALLAEFEKTYQEYFDPDFRIPLVIVHPKENDPKLAEAFDLARQISTASGEALTELIAQSMTNFHAFAGTAIGLRRMVELDPLSAPEAADQAIQNHGTGEGSRVASISEVVRAWAHHDPDGALAWIRGAGFPAMAALPGVIDFVTEEQRDQIFAEVHADNSGESWSDPYTQLLLSQLPHSPRETFQLALGSNNDELFADLAFRAFVFGENLSEMAAIGNALQELPQLPPDGTAHAIVEQWSEADLGSATAYGVDWLLRSDAYSKVNLIRTWSGETDPSENTTEQSTFGCLRCWALTQPAEMQTWINTQNDPEVREALQWLKDHPNGK